MMVRSTFRRFLPLLLTGLFPVVQAAAPSAGSGLDIAGLSKTVAACTDFYTYANGEWLNKTTIPPDRSSWGVFAEVALRNETILKQALDAAAANPGAIAGLGARKATEYFLSGMDVATIEQLGATPLAAELARIDSIVRVEDLPAAFARLNRLGIAAPFNIEIKQDEKDATRYLVNLSQGGLGLPDRDFYFIDDAKSAEWRREYLKHIAGMLARLGASEADAQRAADRVFALEKQLAEASMTAVETRDPQAVYNPRTLAKLSLQARGMAWDGYFRAAKARAPGKLNVAQPKFAAAVAKLSRGVPLADWKQYLRWHLVNDSANKMASSFQQEHFRFFDGVLDGKKEQPPRYRQVVNVVGGTFGDLRLGEGLSQLYVEKAFSADAKAKALVMVGHLKQALGERLEALDWMAPATKKKAREKLAAMQIKIGYPDRWRDFSAIPIDRKAYLVNTWRLNEAEFDRNLKKLGKPVDRGAWEMGAYIVNAYYNPNLNEIVFPAGILQPPYFDPGVDDALNYGGIGMVIGHEITHGFDDAGRQYDARGNLRDWWSKQDAAQYLARSEAIVRQFDAYEGVEGLKVNGKLTLGENISDLGGLKIAFLGLQKALQNKRGGLIDGLSPERRFFLAYAQSWRSLVRPEVERVRLTSDGHSPARYRVRGPLANLPEFAAAFDCKAADGALRAADARVNIW